MKTLMLRSVIAAGFTLSAIEAPAKNVDPVYDKAPAVHKPEDKAATRELIKPAHIFFISAG